jgi:hypothetical protein
MLPELLKLELSFWRGVDVVGGLDGVDGVAGGVAGGECWSGDCCVVGVEVDAACVNEEACTRKFQAA